MKKEIVLILSVVSFMFLTFIIETKVQAQTYEEVSYDDLVNQLNKKRNRVSESGNPSILDDITLHAGFGLLSSALQVETIKGTTQLQMSGFQMSFGIDLFSPYWVAEGAIRNFGTGTSGDEYYSFRELDMKVLYRSLVLPGDVGTRFGAGLATQYLTMTDISGTSVNESAPASIFFAGLEGKINKSFAVVAELGYRSALLPTTANRSSLDLTLRLDSFF